MTIAVAPTQSDIQVALRAFLVSILPSFVEVVAGQDNRVPEPIGPDFVVFWPIRRRRIETNVDSQPDADTKTALQPTEVTFQLDVHGPESADHAQIISTLFRDEYAVNAFAASGIDVAPLHADDPRQIPFINQENQFENRWVVEALLQANQVVTVSQDSANVVEVDVISVDATYPP